MNIYITPDNEKKLRNQEGSMSGLINGLLEGYFNDTAPVFKQPTPHQTPLKESPYSPPVIRNLATDEPVEDDWNKRYDPKYPFKSPFGPIPIQQVSPMAVCDPNYDDEINLPLDVDERNAWLERE